MTLITLALAALPTVGSAGPFDDLASIEILPGWRNASGEHMAGIRITLDPGWKTYWRSEERRVGKECRYRWSPDH